MEGWAAHGLLPAGAAGLVPGVFWSKPFGSIIGTGNAGAGGGGRLGARIDQAGRHQHQHLDHRMIDALGLEQLSQHRHARDPRRLLVEIGGTVVEQSGDGEGLAIA